MENQWFNEEYQFVKVPVALLEDEGYKGLSAGAILLYSLLLDRVSLSAKNGDKYRTEKGEIFVIYTNNEMCEKLRCSTDTVVRLEKELALKNLIRKESHDTGRKKRIIVYDFKPNMTQNSCSYSRKNRLNMTQNSCNYSRKNRHCIDANSDTNQTNNNHTYINHTNISTPSLEEIRGRVEYEVIKEDKNVEIIDELIELMLDVYTTQSENLTISGEKYPTQYVQKRFDKIDVQVITDVAYAIANSKKKIKSLRKYMMYLLFTQPVTTNSEVASLVSATYRN